LPDFIHTAAGGLSGLIFLAISPDGSRLYATGDEDDGHGKVYVIDTSSKTVVNTIVRTDYFALGPIAVAPERRTLAPCVSSTTTQPPATTTTQPPVTTTTQPPATTTTQPPSTTTSTLPRGCSTARDCLQGLEASALCGGETLKPGFVTAINKKLRIASAKLETAASGGKARKVAKAVKKAKASLTQIQKSATKAAARKKQPISADCRDHLTQAVAPTLQRISEGQY
jgi:hypothetical protein